MSDQRSSDCDQSKRDIPSFIEPRPPLILNPFMRPRPQKGTNLLELFDEDSECEEPELVQVYLRLKPCNVRSNLYEVKSDRCLITSVDTAPMGHGRRTQHNVSKMYTFSHIFGSDSNQKEIFEQVVKENLKKLPEGHNFTLLTYGASGSGKTYTLMGTVQAPGLVPRSLEYVFRVVDAAQQPLYKPVDGEALKLEYYDQDFELQFVRRLRQVSVPLRDKYRRMSSQLRSDMTASTLDLSNRTRYYVWVSFVEIYNESIFDLLSHCDRSKSAARLRIREDAAGQVYVKGATQAFVRSGSEAYDVLVAGKHNLQVAATGVHANSSRSHCIFTITMLTETEAGVRASCVRLCDLAGSERQRRARNTGARMQESRAINSSLHVLERCLHMLRRKQKKIDATLVPYRESKLTRLLGAGLSGARGEAVSMVVTLNPSPEYQHETRHVLQLAAVARDIQVNQTIQEASTFESTQDSVDRSEAEEEVFRLRAENERLHYELVQAETRCKDLMNTMEEQLQENAATMTELVEEAKDMTSQYYQRQLQALRTEMKEMQEEYESKLEAFEDTTRSQDDGKRLSCLQSKVTALMMDIAILQEKLTAEKLARARAEQEVKHLRACLQDRDEKADQESGQDLEDAASDTCDSEEESDPYNESLEPTFKKEEINRWKLIRQSVINENTHKANDNNDSNNSDDDSTNVTVEAVNKDDVESDDSVNVTISIVDKDNDNNNETLHDDSRRETNESPTNVRNDSNVSKNLDGTQDIVVNTNQNDDTARAKKMFNKCEVIDLSSPKCFTTRGTYFVKNDESNAIIETHPTVPDLSVFTSTVDKLRESLAGFGITLENNFADNLTEREGKIERVIDKKSSLSAHRSDVSLANFEQLEMASKADVSNQKTTEPMQSFSSIKILKEKRNFFEDNNNENDLIPKLNKNPKTPYFDDHVINKNLVEVKKLMNEDRSPSIVKEDVSNNFEPSAIKKLLGESFTRHTDRQIEVFTVSKPTKQVSLDIFAGFDSPSVAKVKEAENAETPINNSSSNSDEIKKNSKLVETNDVKTASPPSKEMNPKSTAENVIKTETSTDIDVFIKPKDVLKPETDESLIRPKLNRFDIDNSVENKNSQNENNIIQTTCKSIENICLNAQTHHNTTKIKLERPTIDLHDDKSLSFKNEKQPESQISYNNTEDFDNLYKDVTPRETEFEQLLSQCQPNVESHKDVEKITYNLRHKINTSVEQPKYNLRGLRSKINSSVFKDKVSDEEDFILYTNKDVVVNKNDNFEKTANDKQETLDKIPNMSEELLLENVSKCESKLKPKRNLRLRRRNNDSDDKSETEKDKLKDIINLQNEFSDVTMDVPAPVKQATKDIESPEKKDDENRPPMSIQSCPSKSVTRSRRKLFTPRAEPLEESLAASGDSNERVRVPRPSYHRARARRRL